MGMRLCHIRLGTERHVMCRTRGVSGAAHRVSVHDAGAKPVVSEGGDAEAREGLWRM